jgi:hypothetical protein
MACLNPIKSITLNVNGLSTPKKMHKHLEKWKWKMKGWGNDSSGITHSSLSTRPWVQTPALPKKVGGGKNYVSSVKSLFHHKYQEKKTFKEGRIYFGSWF